MERLAPQPDNIPHALSREHATKPSEIINPLARHEVQEYIEDVLEYIRSPLLEEKIEEGHITFAMLRPHAENNTQMLSDSDIHKKVKERIEGEEFTILEELSSHLSPDFVDSFYSGGPKDIMQTLPPTNPEKFSTKWEEFIDSMTNGPTTIFLLHHEDDAIARWRSTIGPTNPDRARSISPESLRAQYAATMDNNLVHGSDSIESVKRELALLSQELTNSYVEDTSAGTSDFTG